LHQLVALYFKSNIQMALEWLAFRLGAS